MTESMAKSAAKKIRELKAENKALQRKISELQKPEIESYLDGAQTVHAYVIETLAGIANIPTDREKTQKRAETLLQDFITKLNQLEKENAKLKRRAAQNKPFAAVLKWLSAGGTHSLVGESRTPRFVLIQSHGTEVFNTSIGIDPFDGERTVLGVAGNQDFYESIVAAFEAYKENVL